MLARKTFLKRSAQLPGARRIAAAMLLLILNACTTVVQRDGPGERQPGGLVEKAPREEVRSRYGNPESYEVFGKRYYTLDSSEGFRERGVASWYGKKFHGRRTSSGETYDMYQMTAAHKALPLPTFVKVINLENNKSAVLKVNDRGPFHDNRIIDLSFAAAEKLGITEKGTAFVEVVALDPAGVEKKPAPATAPTRRTIAPNDPHGIFLQIGAFTEKPNAERLSQRVADYVPAPVRVHESREAGSAIYRVQLGPIATVDSADHLVTTLFGLGIDQHHFVTN